MNKFSFEINVTKQCNFKCSYCFEADHCTETHDIENHIPEIYDRIDELLSDDWWNENHDIMDIVFWGGEPTLKPNIIRNVVERYKNNDKVSFMMYSNGYIVDELIDIFNGIEERLNLQISYDGNPIHDKQRLHRNGGLTSDTIKNNVKKLLESGIKPSLKSTIVLSDLKHFDEAWQDIKDFGLETGHLFRYSPTIEYHDGETPLDFLGEFEDSLKRYVKKELHNIKDGNRPVLGWLGNDKSKCGFTTSGLFVDIDGGIYYCHGCSYVEDPSVFRFSELGDINLIEKLKSNKEDFRPVYNQTCDMCIASVCLGCNVVKYINSSKDGFFDRWNDYTCQENLCEYYKLFGKYDEVLKRLTRRI